MSGPELIPSFHSLENVHPSTYIPARWNIVPSRSISRLGSHSACPTVSPHHATSSWTLVNVRNARLCVIVLEAPTHTPLERQKHIRTGSGEDDLGKTSGWGPT